MDKPAQATWRTLALAAALLAPAAPPARPQQEPAAAGEPVLRALLIGVGAYPDATGWPALPGVRADVLAVRRALLERGGFRQEHVSLLLDEQATRAGILSALQDLAASAGRGDLLLVFYAGHGSRLPDDDGDEIDGWDETLVPYDGRLGEDGGDDVRDDDVRRFIEAANAATDDVVLIFDCCASGTNVRGGDGLVSRFLAPARRGLGEARPGQAGGREAAAPAAPAAPASASGYFPADTSYVALSACRSTEDAYEIDLGADGDGQDASAGSRGLFSFALERALYELEPGMTYLDLSDRVRRAVREHQPGQTPVIEGPLRRRPLFAGRARAQAPYFELRRSEGAWRLQAGRIHGLAPGALLAVMDGRAAQPTAQDRLGHLRVVTAGSDEAQVEWIDGSGAAASPPPATGDAPAVLRAFLLRQGPVDDRLEVAVVGADDALCAALTRGLEATGTLQATPPSRARYEVRLAEPDEWQVVTRGGTRLPLSAAARDTAAVAQLVSGLHHLGRARQIAATVRNEQGRGLEIAWALECVDPDDGAPLGPLDRDDAGVPRLVAGQAVAARIQNRSPVPVWATLLVIAPDGEVQVAHETQGEEPIPPGREVKTRRMQLSIEPGAEPWFAEGEQTFLWVVTSRPHDLSGLEQPSIVERTTTRGAPVDAARVLTPDPGAPADDAWLTRSVDVWVAPAAAPR